MLQDLGQQNLPRFSCARPYFHWNLSLNWRIVVFFQGVVTRPVKLWSLASAQWLDEPIPFRSIASLSLSMAYFLSISNVLRRLSAHLAEKSSPMLLLWKKKERGKFPREMFSEFGAGLDFEAIDSLAFRNKLLHVVDTLKGRANILASLPLPFCLSNSSQFFFSEAANKIGGRAKMRGSPRFFGSRKIHGGCRINRKTGSTAATIFCLPLYLPVLLSSGHLGKQGPIWLISFCVCGKNKPLLDYGQKLLSHFFVMSSKEGLFYTLTPLVNNAIQQLFNTFKYQRFKDNSLQSWPLDQLLLYL